MRKCRQSVVVKATEMTNTGEQKPAFLFIRRNPGADYLVLSVTPDVGNRSEPKSVYLDVEAARKLLKTLAFVLED